MRSRLGPANEGRHDQQRGGSHGRHDRAEKPISGVGTSMPVTPLTMPASRKVIAIAAVSASIARHVIG